MSNKIGRNEPCPCGSGKKYKKCCGISGSTNLSSENSFYEDITTGEDIFALSSASAGGESMKDAFKRYDEYVRSGQADRDGGKSFMEFMGRPNSASTVISGLTKGIGEMVFSSKKEADDYFESYVSSVNNTAHEDFFGLTSTQMHTILDAGNLEDVKSIVSLKDGLASSLFEQTRMYQVLKYILQAYQESGGALPITAAGSYKPVLVKEICTRFFTEDEYEFDSKIESECNHITFIHEFLAFGDYIDENTSKSYLNEKGKLLLNADAYTVWKALFKYAVYSSDWLKQIRKEFRFSHFSHIQYAAVFSLYILQKKGSVWLSEEDLYALFRKAYPDFDPEYENDPFPLGRSFYFSSTFSFFAREFGLIEFDCTDFKSYLVKPKIRMTPLFKQVFDWNI